MRKVVVYELLSLDGIAEQPDEFITDFDETMRENLGRVISDRQRELYEVSRESHLPTHTLKSTLPASRRRRTRL
jgi:hypothetical protein